jgi:hypothetical protein
MTLDHSKVAADPQRRLQLRNKLRVLLAAIGTLAAVVGIGVCVNGLLEFNKTKVVIGACVIVVSTITYIVMLTRAS